MAAFNVMQITAQWLLRGALRNTTPLFVDVWGGEQ